MPVRASTVSSTVTTRFSGAIDTQRPLTFALPPPSLSLTGIDTRTAGSSPAFIPPKPPPPPPDREYLKEALNESQRFKAAKSIESVNDWNGNFLDSTGRAQAVNDLKARIKESVDRKDPEPVYIVTHSKGGEIAYSALSDPSVQQLIKDKKANVTLVTTATNADLLVDGLGKNADARLPGVKWTNVYYDPAGPRGDIFASPINVAGRNVEISKVPGVDGGVGFIGQQHSLAYQPDVMNRLVQHGDVPDPKGKRVIAISGTDPGETRSGRLSDDPSLRPAPVEEQQLTKILSR
jgi:hypothetical protein